MATTVGQHSVSTFATPVNGGPLDANVVRGNDNTIRSAYVAHDSDTGIHVQSSTLAQRPTAGTAGRKWITTDAGDFHLWYDDGTTWHEVGTATLDIYVLADETLAKGDVVKVTGYNVGNNAPRVAKVSSASDIAFGMVTAAITNGAVGYITNTGIISGLTTNSFAIGDILYPNTSGGLTTTKPTSGNYQPVAYVLRSSVNTGVIYVEFSAPRIVEASANTASTIVLRDASGNFSAGTITAGALTSTGLVTFASLKGTGSTTVTDILNDGTMATASATTLATSASIKTYVDSQVATVDTLAEVLANGNTTGTNNIIVTNGQKITTNTIDETTAAAGVTIDSVLLKDNEVTATGLKVTNLKANDGTAAGSIANSTGIVTLASSVLTTTDINGGTVDGVTIGGASAGAATFTNVTASGTINLTGATVSNGGSVTTIDINGGTIDGTTIGGNSAAAGTFTTINATSINATTFDMTNLEVTNIKAKDGTASMTVADTTGDVTVSAALVANGNVTLGNATSDTITVGGSFPTGTKLRTDSGVGNTLAVSAYDVDGTAYVDLITATASNTPTLALTSTGVGSMNNIAIGGSTPAAGAFTTLGSSGDFAVATNKFTVASATGNTAVAGTLTTEGTLTSNGNTVLGNAATDTITATAQFVTGTQLKSAQSANNTLALSAYDVDGTAYVDLVKLTAGNTPTLTLTSTGVGSLDNITIGGSTAAAGSFTSLSASGNFTLGTDVVLSRGAANRLDLASGDSLNLVAGDISVTGNISASGTLTLGSDVVLSRGAADRLDLASGDSMNVVSGDYRIGNTSVLNSTTLGSGVTASSLTSVGTLSSLTVSGDLTVDTSTLKVDSTNNRVGIGTATPGARLDIMGTTSDQIRVGTAATEHYRIGRNQSDGLLDFYGSQTGFQGYRFGGIDGTWAVINASGNLGLGVTPSAWGTFKVIEFPGGSVAGYAGGSGNNQFALFNNAYYGSGGFIYKTTDTAQMYRMLAGKHEWHIAPSGNQGNTITFTQAMTLDASGNLEVKRTNATQNQPVISFTDSQDNTGFLGIRSAVEAGEQQAYLAADTGLSFGRFISGTYTERARITSGGVFCVAKTSDDDTVVGMNFRDTGYGTFTRSSSSNSDSTVHVYSTGAGAYRFYVGMGGTVYATNTTISAISDARLKENVRDLDVGLDAILALKPRTFDWKEGKGKDIKNDRGFIAQEFEEVFPDLIDEWKDPAPEGEEPYRSVRQDLIPVLVKAIQELDAKNKALEARLEALEA